MLKKIESVDAMLQMRGKTDHFQQELAIVSAHNNQKDNAGQKK